MILEFWASITKQKVVWLLDHDGEVTKTVAKLTPFGYVAKRWWPFNTHNVRLLPDGIVSGASYVKEWRDTS